jgi:hypothetical protein
MNVGVCYMTVSLNQPQSYQEAFRGSRIFGSLEKKIEEACFGLAFPVHTDSS